MLIFSSYYNIINQIILGYNDLAMQPVSFAPKISLHNKDLLKEYLRQYNTGQSSSHGFSLQKTSINLSMQSSKHKIFEGNFLTLDRTLELEQQRLSKEK